MRFYWRLAIITVVLSFYGWGGAGSLENVAAAEPLSNVTGRIVLQDYPGNIAQVPVNVELRKQGGPTTTMTMNLNSDGSFTISDLEAGSYDLTFKASHWLQKVVWGVQVGTTLPDIGVNASLNGQVPFPSDNPWNQRIDSEPVDPNSDTLINSIGRTTHLHPDFGADWDGGPFGIPYIVVSGSTPKIPVSFLYDDESDPGPYPIPANPPIEGGPDSTGDRHILVIDRDNWMLYELFSAYPNGSSWTAGSGAIFDLNSNNLRPAGWTSADAAGLPIFPGLVRYDEVEQLKEIRHALRFTVFRTRRAYVYPARHFASSNTSTSLPPMGMRVRLKASFDISPYPPSAQVILTALKRYGMMVADNGSNWYISGTADSRWNDEELNTLKQLTGNDFEVVKMGPVVTQ